MKTSAVPLSSINPKYHAQITAALHGKKAPPQTGTAPKREAKPKSVPREPFAPLEVAIWAEAGIPAPKREYRFHEERKWRFDYAWPVAKVALEVEGGVWTGGRHTRGKGFLADIEKYNEAACLGWRVVRCVPDTLLSGETASLLQRLLL